ncbi:MAG: glycosyltransferase family 4 protein [Methanobacteriaceae archaeon]|nr:glycosyltransferase family 4 protein [Methanobacteriaceae archaeon]
MKVILIRSRAIDPAINKVADCLSKHGCKVKLLLWDRNADSNDDQANYKKITFNLRAPYDKFHIVFYLPFWWLFEFIYLLKDDSDVIHATDLDTLIPASLVKLIKGKKLYYTIYDFYADNLPSSIPRFFKNFISGLEKYFIGFTDVLFLADESRLVQIESSKTNQIYYIYNSPPDYFRNITIPSNQGITLNKQLVLFYGGLLHESRGLFAVIKAINGTNIKLIFAGEGSLKNEIKDLTRINENIKYKGFLDYEDIINETLAADVLFAFYDPAIPNNRYASPNKLFEAMMSGKPIIVNDGTSMANIVQKEGCGIIVPYGNAEFIKKAIVTLKDPSIYEKLGKNGRNAYEKKYKWSIMEKRLLKAYNIYKECKHTGMN